MTVYDDLSFIFSGMAEKGSLSNFEARIKESLNDMTYKQIKSDGPICNKTIYKRGNTLIIQHSGVLNVGMLPCSVKSVSISSFIKDTIFWCQIRKDYAIAEI